MTKPFLAPVAVLVWLAGPAFAEKRVALVVGNSAYQYVGRLDNPKNDAKLIADTLRAAGFTVIGGGAQIDLDKAAFDAAVQSFGTELQGADVGLFYYAGHGIQLRGTNYLVPISANPTRESDVDFQMLDVTLVLRQMEGSGTKLNLVILDACRNNPFGGRGLRATVGGLAQMQAPEGTLISYATQPGNVAQDGADGDSPYTRALAQTIKRPGLGIFDAFNEVGLAVKRSTGGTQQPWVSSSPIDGKFYFTAPAVAVTAPAASPSAEETTWSFLKDSKDPEQLRRFVEQFPASPHRLEAAAKILALQPQKLAAAPPEPAASAPDVPAPAPATAVAPAAAPTPVSAPTLGKPKTVNIDATTHAFEFTPDGQKIVSLTGGRTFKIVDPQSGATISSPDGELNGIGQALFSPDIRLVAATEWNDDFKGRIRLWEVTTGRVVRILETPGAPLAFTRDGRRLVTGAISGTDIRIWDVASGTAIRTLSSLPFLGAWVAGLSADGRELALLHRDGRVSLWDAGNGTKLRMFKPSGVHEDDLGSIALSPDGRWVAAGGKDKLIRLWDVQTGTLRTLVGHGNGIKDLAFSPDSRQLASSSDDNTLKLWDVETGRAVRSVGARAGHPLYSRDGRRLALRSDDATLTVWPLEPASAVAGK